MDIKNMIIGGPICLISLSQYDYTATVMVGLPNEY